MLNTAGPGNTLSETPIKINNTDFVQPELLGKEQPASLSNENIQEAAEWRFSEMLQKRFCIVWKVILNF